MAPRLVKYPGRLRVSTPEIDPGNPSEVYVVVHAMCRRSFPARRRVPRAPVPCGLLSNVEAGTYLTSIEGRVE